MPNIPDVYDEATLEVAFKGRGALFMQFANSNTSGKLSAAFQNRRVVVKNRNQNTFNATSNNVIMGDFCTLSVQMLRVVLNARSIDVADSVAVNMDSNMVALGGYSQTSHLLSGEIFAIRYYNRKLTDYEIHYNQQVDNVRFELGLDLTGGIVPYVPNRSLTLSRTIDEDDDNE